MLKIIVLIKITRIYLNTSYSINAYLLYPNIFSLLYFLPPSLYSFVNFSFYYCIHLLIYYVNYQNNCNFFFNFWYLERCTIVLFFFSNNVYLWIKLLAMVSFYFRDRKKRISFFLRKLFKIYLNIKLFLIPNFSAILLVLFSFWFHCIHHLLICFFFYFVCLFIYNDLMRKVLLFSSDCGTIFI